MSFYLVANEYHCLQFVVSNAFFLVMQQHQQQLVSLQQHKQQLEKHKKELEDLSMLSLFPKFLYKAGDVWNPPPTTQTFPGPAGTPMSSTSTLINLAQHKKQTSTKKQERATGVPASQPIQQHLMQVGNKWDDTAMRETG